MRFGYTDRAGLYHSAPTPPGQPEAHYQYPPHGVFGDPQPGFQQGEFGRGPSGSGDRNGSDDMEHLAPCDLDLFVSFLVLCTFYFVCLCFDIVLWFGCLTYF